MQDCLSLAPHTKIRKVCEVAGVSKSTFYYNRNNDSQAQKDAEIVTLLKKLPQKILLHRQFCAAEPLKKLCTDVSYLRTTKGWLYLSPCA